ncbi:glycosyltransferase [Lactobacillus delbrueckii]|uniref:Glycosyltransferase n=2 Tax=Lactobacillus delbrueckii TaxID=1584 RepID=A0A4V2E0Z3_9LACO|nr:glycosyltransferase [Lactobacillus delbrueckii]
MNVKLTQERVHGRVIFTGYVDHAELYKYHNIADCAVVPSVWEEPAGLVVIEALMSGDPLIVTRVGGATEYVNDKSAIIVDRGAKIEENLKEAILKIKENPKLRKRMSN